MRVDIRLVNLIALLHYMGSSSKDNYLICCGTTGLHMIHVSTLVVFGM